ncbi:Uncharacterised protein [Chryseobacterium gleum]|uniref:Uncharacterized protein n=2 Tax=Chryseobacterium gleum TaxID=250 RepID=A0A448B909_CHRGE|nr:Uncharacterised protein [Chryseobacterium gleum]
MISALVAVSFCYLMTSCAGLRNEQLKIQLEKSNCNQLSIYSYTAQDIPTPIEHLKIDSDLKKNFGRKSLNIANAIGALHLLKKYADLKKITRNTLLLKNVWNCWNVHKKLISVLI